MLIAPHNSSVDSLIPANLRKVESQIALAAAAAHRTVESITVIAVSKGHEAQSLRAAATCGVRHFGESYVQEAVPKIQSLRDLPLVWHFIGRLQANKSRLIAESFDWVHAVDRPKIAERLSQQRPHYALPLQVCIQVNIAGETGKAGVEPATAAELALAVLGLPRLRLRGLACILPADRPADENRRAFRDLRSLAEQINRTTGAGLDTLSMGMSADYREAILEGATLLRIGTAIFGPRQASADE
jgi:pyridoxal phosphate enzyme (YggS family)